MMGRTYLGLDVRTDGLRAVALNRKRRGFNLAGGRLMALDSEVVRPSVREPNVVKADRFVAAIREVLDPLAGREERIALSLPETCGRVMLTQVETAFKSRREGIEILKWQLKSQLPVEPRDVRLDYQILEKTETGYYRVAVAVLARNVLDQYEELLARAGYHALVIDFTALNIYNFYRSRLASEEAFLLVGIDQGLFSLQYFRGGTLAFHRSRVCGTNPETIFQELNRSAIAGQENFAGFRRGAIFLHTDWQEPQTLQEAMGAVFEREAVLLDPHFERLSRAGLNLPPWRARGLVAATGAAELLM